LLSELLWLRALNAVGDKDSLRKNLALYEYASLLTDLDPRFYEAYLYLGINIPYSMERVWQGGDRAEILYRKGLTKFPSDLRLHLYLGFSLMHHQRKFLEASEVFAAGSRLPNAMRWMGPLAARLRAQGGAPEDALNLVRELLASTEDEVLKQELEERAVDLQIEAVLQKVDAAVEAWKKSNSESGAGVPTLEQLVTAGLYQGPREDVKGGRVYVRETDGKAMSTSVERRLEIYE
jgi:hypothetical protein